MGLTEEISKMIRAGRSVRLRAVGRLEVSFVVGGGLGFQNVGMNPRLSE